MLNTDFLNLHRDILKDGFPASSVKVTELDFPPDSERSKIILNRDDYCWYNIMLNKNNIRYHLENIFSNDHLKKYHNSIMGSSTSQAFLTELRDLAALSGSNLEYASNIEEFCFSQPADIVFCKRHPDGISYIDFVHLASPNGWSAEDAIGKPFSYFHEDVKRLDESNVVPAKNGFVDYLIDSGKTYERIGAFSIRPSYDPDRHPDKTTEKFYYGGKLYLRFERQLIVSVPEMEGFIFFIYTHFVDMDTDREFFRNAIKKADPNCYLRSTLDKWGKHFLLDLRG